MIPSLREHRVAGRRLRLLVCSISVICASLVVQLASAQDVRAPTRPRVSVLDAGTFIVVEAQQARLGEVFEKIKAQLNVDIAYHFEPGDRPDMSRIIEGRRSGTVQEVLRWLVPDWSFILQSAERNPGQLKDPRVERIYFLSTDGAGTSVGGKKPEAPQRSQQQASGSVFTGSESKEPAVTHSTVTGARSVAEQLEPATLEAQFRVDQQGRSASPVLSQPEFQWPSGDATLQQQLERSHALVLEQLRNLMNAYSAACEGKGVRVPC